MLRPWLISYLFLATACGARSGLDVGASPEERGEGGRREGGDAPLTLDPSSVNPHGPLPEVCNGLDDDWNGIIDDGFSWRGDPNREAVRVSTDDNDSAETSGLASDGSDYVAFYEGGTWGALSVFATPLARDGASLRPEEPLSRLSQSHGGAVHGRAIAWAGDRYGVAWISQRDSYYDEIYFALLDANDAKLEPGDVRLSYEGGFGFNPSLHWTGERFIVVWSDLMRVENLIGAPSTETRIFARSVLSNGSPGPEVTEVTSGLEGSHDSPFVTVAGDRIAVVWIASDFNEVQFALLNLDLERVAGPVALTPSASHGEFVRVAHLGSGWAAVWHGTDDGDRTIWGVLVDDTGALVDEARPIIETTGHARYPFLISLGDRALLVYSDDRDGMQGYEVYATMLSATLTPVGPLERVTQATGDSIFPTAVLGPEGDLGILFRDDRLGWGQVFFTRLECQE